MTWVTNNFLWHFYPKLPGQLLLLYLVGIAVITDRFRFTVLFLIFVTGLLFFYRKPTPRKKSTFTTQICNIDGRCRTLDSSAFLEKDDIISPAFGKVAKIELDNNKLIVSINLSLLDIHSQYSPISGTVTKRLDVPGVSNLLEITQTQARKITVKQIAGSVARTITSNIEKNDSLTRGEYIGFIHLGSKVKLTLPANGVNLLIKVGDFVDGYNTVIGRWFGI